MLERTPEKKQAVLNLGDKPKEFNLTKNNQTELPHSFPCGDEF
jgi:hypothetical protein